MSHNGRAGYVLNELLERQGALIPQRSTQSGGARACAGRLRRRGLFPVAILGVEIEIADQRRAIGPVCSP
ncbi:MAG: hypothetical protein N2444_01280 [Methylocystis sp.]|nr:hypothetical protein [Methylocystis sp.]